MASCLDFAEEVTALQHLGNELGVSVLITPKFHAEMAGEGVEYSWGVSRNVYRRMPLNSKKGKESFKALVHECTSRDILSTKTVRKLSRRARSYICAYFVLHESKNNGNDMPLLTLPLIERLVKAFKTHRVAVDFDAGFVNSFVPAIDVAVGKDEKWKIRFGKRTRTKFLKYWVYMSLRYVGSGWNKPYNCSITECGWFMTDFLYGSQ